MQNANKKIAKNTMFLYIRMLFSMLIALYTSRIILNTLGFVDYGLYNVIVGVITLFTFLNGALGTSTSRFLTFELGKNDTRRLQQVFNSSFYIHLGIALIIVLIAETIGLWIVNHQLTIPEDRLYACNIVYQFVIITAALSIIQVPLTAMIISHERIKVYAIVGVFDTILKLCIAISLAYFSYDKLIVFSFFQMLISISIYIFYYTYSKKKFQGIRIDLKFNKGVCREMLGYSMWNLLGSSAVMLKEQGINILINIFFGPAVNAANAIAYQVNQAVSNFSSNFIIAINPQIIKSYANEEREKAKELIFRGGRFSFFLLMIIFIPILLETETILQIWLKNAPEYSNILTRLVIILALIECFIYTIGSAIQAVGRIKYYQIVISGTLLLNFPLSYIAYKQGANPEIALVISIILSFITVYIRLFFLKRYLGISVKEYLNEVILNALLVLFASLFIPFLFHQFMNSGFIRLLAVTATSVLSSIIFIYLIGLRNNEKKLVILYLKKIRIT